MLGNLFKQLLDVLINNPDVPIATVLAFMALVLPFSLTFTIPWGSLPRYCSYLDGYPPTTSWLRVIVMH